MFKIRKVVYALLIPLLLDLLVFSAAVSAERHDCARGISSLADQSATELVACEEYTGEETEISGLHLPPIGTVCIYTARPLSKRTFFSPSGRKSSLSSGWSLPLLI